MEIKPISLWDIYASAEIKPISLWDIYTAAEKQNPMPPLELDGYMLTPESCDRMLKWFHDNTPQYIKDLSTEEDEWG
jgi:hypothetical protein